MNMVGMGVPDRILTSHVGSLPRPHDLVALLRARHAGQPCDVNAIRSRVQSAVDEVVERQARLGIDYVSDGEMGKVSYATYVSERLSGFGGAIVKGHVAQDLSDYHELSMSLLHQGVIVPTATGCACNGPISVKDTSALQDDLDNLQQAVRVHRPLGAFLTSASPGVIAVFQRNEHYPTEDAYLEALAEAMRAEYEAIYRSGFILQLDSPDLAMNRHLGFRGEELSVFKRAAERQVEALNHATRNIPPEAMRIHLCWGNYVGPHHHDVALEDIWDIVIKTRPRVIALEAANPRHAHEWEVLAELDIPEDKVLMPGMLDTCTNYLEHPTLIAQRICLYANIVGRERVIAGSDCGFSTFAGVATVHPDVAWAKLEALVEGARRASDRLWRSH